MARTFSRLLTILAFVSAGLGGRAAAQVSARTTACVPSWLPTFGQAPGLDRADSFTPTGSAEVVFDDGTGPALYVGGSFTKAGGAPANHIARWDGSSWSELGAGLGSTCLAMAVFDDGGGPALYASGDFTSAGGAAANRIAKWDGSSWSSLGSGLGGSGHALTVFDDGGGPALYVGGNFTSAGGAPASRIAKWDGSSWSALGSGLDSFVYALTVFDDGSGPALHAGGLFATAGGAPANRVARWDGSSWSALSVAPLVDVYALAVFDAGSGPRLHAGTSSGTSGTVLKWTGSSWMSVGTMNSLVRSLTVFDDGGGTALYAGGHFTAMSGGPSPANRVAKWNGSSWTALGLGVSDPVHALAAFDDGSGPALFVTGSLTAASNLQLDRIAKWDGAAWSTLGEGLNDRVLALEAFDDGNGAALFAAGDFRTAGGAAANRIARWDGSSWSALGNGRNDTIYALETFDDGSGPALFAGGIFRDVGGALTLSKWDGSSWSEVGAMSGPVNCLAAFDDGGGPALYVGGQFSTAGGVPANRIARWDGSAWSTLGSGMSNGVVYALAVFDDGTGAALYAGGDFTSAGGVPANRIARWDGASWSALGSGVNNAVFALTTFDDGGGPALIAGGSFAQAGGSSANRIAKWNGSSWSSFGSVFGQGLDVLRSLQVHDDGSGPALYVGGDFTQVTGGLPASRIARWNGSSWSALGNGVNGTVSVLASFDDGNGQALHAGGAFTSAPDSLDSHLARWRCPDALPPELLCPDSILAFDSFAGPAGMVVTFSVTASDDQDPSPTVVCTPPSGSFFPRGTTLVTCTATDASGNQATCEFPITVALKTRQR